MAGKGRFLRPRPHGAVAGGGCQGSGAARAQPPKPGLLARLPVGRGNRSAAEVKRLLCDEFSGIDIRLSSDYSPSLAKALMRRKLDAAFLRIDETMEDIACKHVRTDPLVFVLPRDQFRLAAQATVAPEDVVNETFYLPSEIACAGGAPGRKLAVFRPRRRSISGRSTRCTMSCTRSR